MQQPKQQEPQLLFPEFNVYKEYNKHSLPPPYKDIIGHQILFALVVLAQPTLNRVMELQLFMETLTCKVAEILEPSTVQ